ncbi:hypothetical protein BDZ89DRAFT_1128051 [Hymenopellis radicata]|nr:hypothetical protein BDZ89DRAFT_1128051 [Hymenopellis radicata]
MVDVRTVSRLANSRENIRKFISAQRKAINLHYSNNRIVLTDTGPALAPLVLNDKGVDQEVHLWLGVLGLSDLEADFAAIGVYDMVNMSLLATTACLLGPEISARVALSLGLGTDPGRVEELLAALAFVIE